MICIDNSEWMRNGDCSLSRFQAQVDAVSLICGAKTQLKLALKHRQNKNQQQRIIVFAGSPIKHEKRALEMIGKKLKKNSVALDIVDFGEDEDGKHEKMTTLRSTVRLRCNHQVLLKD
ncbi:hypothetical protein ERO13_D10G154650v2 [Gossypium hirsutum]|uniref:VWFA domain-containing protein n=3 Tax=Gossypium TaxID=3633 RepID=A0A5J5PT15_GOSBA|nr:hypothetical protein ES319_D10G171200v1 [Gossypium barbadense]KAG4126410.1 hypothetical protein ERO13_D10G154650v2 [Gossypium hirsutum]TYG50543.1 hypothetical protein ES288_D10G183800v1 [Gossypium darwinii]TYH50168.1 hypothetical protein ES332_D10G186500v1 [Gossypium tomentosum]